MILNLRVVAFARQREITGEPLNSRSRILAPNRREITGVDCTIITWTNVDQDDVLCIIVSLGDDKLNDDPVSPCVCRCSCAVSASFSRSTPRVDSVAHRSRNLHKTSAHHWPVHYKNSPPTSEEDSHHISKVMKPFDCDLDELATILSVLNFCVCFFSEISVVCALKRSLMVGHYWFRQWSVTVSAWWQSNELLPEATLMLHD